MTDSEKLAALINSQVQVNLALASAVISLWPQTPNPDFVQAMKELQEANRRVIELMRG
jgi:hypothetical protein